MHHLGNFNHIKWTRLPDSEKTEKTEVIVKRDFYQQRLTLAFLTGGYCCILLFQYFLVLSLFCGSVLFPTYQFKRNVL